MMAGAFRWFLRGGLRLLTLCALVSAGAVAAGRVLPHRGQIAFNAASPPQVEDSSTIFALDIAHSVLLPLARLDRAIFPLAWSPDGQYIAFHTMQQRTADSAQRQQVMLMRSSGRELRPIATYGPDVVLGRRVIWSPDSRTVAVVVYQREAVTVQLHVIDIQQPDPPQVIDITPVFVDWDIPLVWSPDSQRLYTARSGQRQLVVYAMDRESGTVQEVRRWHTGFTLVLGSPVVGPGGVQVALAGRGPGGETTDLHVFDLADGQRRTLPSQPRLDEREPVWSNDGTQLAYPATRDSAYGLYAAAADGSRVRELVPPREGVVALQGWSPDDAQLAYRIIDRSGAHLCVFDLRSGFEDCPLDWQRDIAWRHPA